MDDWKALATGLLWRVYQVLIWWIGMFWAAWSGAMEPIFILFSGFAVSYFGTLVTAYLLDVVRASRIGRAFQKRS